MRMKQYNNAVKVALIMVCLCVWVVFLVAQSPANPTQDINASNGFSTVSAIELTYNNGRRQEEIQLNLPTNSIKKLNLPSDAEWDALNDDQKMLFLVNDERTSRAGINYGAGPVLGLPFAGVAEGVDNVSNTYAQTLFNADAFTHTYNGTSPSSRISGAYGTTCVEFTSRSEDLYASVSSGNTGFPRAVEKALYAFNYDDAGSGWGHREMSLLQDKDLQGRSWGFNNNEGSVSSEGYIGVGVYRGTNYGGFGSNWNYGVVLVLNFFDPSPTCTYTVIYDSNGGTTDPDPDPVGPNPCDEPMSVNGTITDNVLKSNKSVTLGASTTFVRPTTISSPDIIVEAGFTIDNGSCVQFVDEGCAYDGTFDCSTTGNGTGTCTSPIALTCGASRNGNNSGQMNTWNSYGNSTGWSGGEVIYSFDMAANSSAIVSLTNLDADFDLLIATSCSNSIALSSAHTGTTNEQVSFSSVGGGTVYIIVDGWNGAEGSYSISISCASAKGDDLISTKAKYHLKKEQVEHMVCEPYVILR